MNAEHVRRPAVMLAPRRLPLLGHAWQLRFRPLQFLVSLRDVRGLIGLKLGPVTAYLVNSPHLVHELLVARQHEFTKAGSPLWETVRILVGNGLGTSEGDTHLAQRRLLQPLFHQSRFAEYTAAMARATDCQISSWAGGQTVAVDEQTYRITATMMSRCMYSGRLDDEAIDGIISRLPVALAGVGRRAALPWLHHLPTPERSRYTKSVRRLHQIVADLIADRRPGREDVIGILREARDERNGDRLSTQQIHDEVMTLLVAGTDITAALIGFTLYLLGSHPEAEQRVHGELDSVLGDGEPLPSFADLARLEYLSRAIAEALRLYPPAWLLPRRASRSTTLAGQPIVEGSYVFYSPFLSHRSPAHFPDPDAFNPDRWLNDPVQAPSRQAYIPFGVGSHKCIGNSFSLIQTQTAIATIMSRWQLRPAHRLRPHVFTSLTPGRLRMIAQKR